MIVDGGRAAAVRQEARGEGHGARLRRWQESTDRLLLLAAALFLVVYALPILRPDLPRTASRWCSVAGIALWAVFAVDVAVRLYLCDDRRRYLLANWLDVLAVALPFLRPLRVLRAVVALSVLTRRGQVFARGRLVAGVGTAVVGACVVASLAVLDAERGRPGATITGFGDALWWSAATVTTVGYGDLYPTTFAGRLVALALMVTGIALLGVVTAALASWFVERIEQVREAEAETGATVDQLMAEVRQLRREVRELSGGPDLT